MTHEWAFIIQADVHEGGQLRVPLTVRDALELDSTEGHDQLHWNAESHSQFLRLAPAALTDGYESQAISTLDAPTETAPIWQTHVPDTLDPVNRSRFVDGVSVFYAAETEMVAADPPSVYLVTASQLETLLAASIDVDPAASDTPDDQFQGPGFLPPELSHQLVELLHQAEPVIIVAHGGLIAEELLERLSQLLGDDEAEGMLTVETLFHDEEAVLNAIPTEARESLNDACATAVDSDTLDLAVRSVEVCLDDRCKVVLGEVPTDLWAGVDRLQSHSENGLTPFPALEKLREKRHAFRQAQEPTAADVGLALGLAREAICELYSETM